MLGNSVPEKEYRDIMVQFSEDLFVVVDRGSTNFLDAIVMAGQINLLNLAFDTAKKLDIHKVLLHRQSARGYTLLHRAVICYNYEISARLIQLGADKKVKDRSGRTPFDTAELVITDQQLLTEFRHLLN